MNNEIKREDYYENMYDIESLTDLNVQRKKRKNNKDVLEVEKLILRNKVCQANTRLNNLLVKKKEKMADSRLKILAGAIWVKNRVFSKEILRNYENMSPKNCALEELAKYLKKSKKEIERKMVVEKPVAQAWKKINPDPKSEKEISDFYIKTDAYVYELMAANHIVQTLYSYFLLKEKLKKLNIKTILDYGAGAGTLSIFFKNLGYSVVFADLPGKLFNFAKWRVKKRKINIPMIDLKKGKIQKKYDCIVCTEVVEHVVNPEALLKSLKSKLKKNGVLVVSESCEYTKDFASHLQANKKYGGKEFIKLMNFLGFRQIFSDPFIPQMIFRRK